MPRLELARASGHRARFAEAVSARGCRVVVADRRADVRSALQLFLDQEPGVHVVGEAASVRALVGLAGRLKPDVIVADGELADGQPPRELASRLRAGCPASRLVMLGTGSVQAMPALPEADAWVSKLDPPEQLLAALFGNAVQRSPVAA